LGRRLLSLSATAVVTVCRHLLPMPAVVDALPPCAIADSCCCCCCRAAAGATVSCRYSHHGSWLRSLLRTDQRSPVAWRSACGVAHHTPST
jgi:hypothetical protein